MPIINETIICGVNAKDATATGADILQGKTAVVGKELITGTMPEKSGQTVNGTFVSGTTGYITGKISQEGHYTTNSRLKIPVTNLAAGNIKKGVNIGGVVGTLEPIPSNYSLFTEYFSPADNDASIVNFSNGSLAIPNVYSDHEGVCLVNGATTTVKSIVTYSNIRQLLGGGTKAMIRSNNGARITTDSGSTWKSPTGVSISSSTSGAFIRFNGTKFYVCIGLNYSTPHYVSNTACTSFSAVSIPSDDYEVGSSTDGVWYAYNHSLGGIYSSSDLINWTKKYTLTSTVTNFVSLYKQGSIICATFNGKSRSGSNYTSVTYISYDNGSTFSDNFSLGMSSASNHYCHIFIHGKDIFVYGFNFPNLPSKVYKIANGTKTPINLPAVNSKYPNIIGSNGNSLILAYNNGVIKTMSV